MLSVLCGSASCMVWRKGLLYGHRDLRRGKGRGVDSKVNIVKQDIVGVASHIIDRYMPAPVYNYRLSVGGQGSYEEEKQPFTD